MREAELKAEAAVEKSAGLASFNTHLRQLNASLLVGNAQKVKQLQALLASNAQKDKQLQALHEKLNTQQEKLIAHLLADSPDLRRVLSREGAE